MRIARPSALLFLVLPACGSGFDAKSAADGHRLTDAPPAGAAGAAGATGGATAKRAPEPACGRGEPCEEPFAIAEVGFDVDVFEKPPAVALPVDADLDIGRVFGSLGTGPEAKSLAPHYASITYAGGVEAFERDVAPPLRRAVAMPPHTWLAFAKRENFKTHATTYGSVVLRLPMLVTSADVVGARAAERTKTTTILGSTPAESKTVDQKAFAVEVTLGDGALERLVRFNELHRAYPLATVVHGRVVEEEHMILWEKQLWVDLPGFAPEEAQRAAEKLAMEIRERSAKK